MTDRTKTSMRAAAWSRLRNATLTITGLIMAVTPLALWMAWSQAVFLLVLSISAAAGVLFCLVLYADTKDASEEHREASSSGVMEDLDDEFLSELSDMGPFVYHNRLNGDARFKRKMARLKELASTNRAENGGSAACC